jgi:hypothetical protein
MNMKRILNKYVIPNPSNEHKPHLLRETGVLVLAYVIVLAFFGSMLQSKLVLSPQFTAEVIPSVLVDLANDDRADNQLASLSFNPTLAAAAKLKAKDMANNQYFAHTSPYDASKTPWYWLGVAGYSFTAAGENLAIDFSDSDDVNRAWMESPGHRANILNSKFSEVGIAIEHGEFEGRPTIYVVQLFGKPRAVAAAPAPAPKPQPSPEATKPAPKLTPLPAQTGTQVAIVTPSTSPTVAGATTKPSSQEASKPAVLAEETPKQNLVTIAEDEKFIAVEEITIGTPELISDAPSNPASTTAETPKYSSWSDRLLASPKRTLEYSYIALSGLILIVILLMVNKEIERHHLKHIFYGLALLVLMYILLSASKAILIGDVLVK